MKKLISKVWDYIRRHPTEVIFGMIIAWFIGMRIVYFAINAFSDSDEMAQKSDIPEVELYKQYMVNDEIIHVEGIGDLHIDQVKSG